MASPLSIREYRYLIGGTFNESHTNAASSSWNAVDDTATKAKITAFDDGGLEKPGLPAEELRARLHAEGPPAAIGLARGSYSVSMYADGAYSNTDSTPSALWLNVAMGGLQAPGSSTRSTTVGAGGSTSNVPITTANTHLYPGMAVLLGTKGDARGGGEVRPVNTTYDGNATLSVATIGAVTSGDAVVFSTTTYLDEDAAESYIDSVHVGHGTADQRQTVGGVPTPAFSGMAAGELPKIDFDVSVGDHQWITTAGDRTTLSKAVVPRGGEPAFERAIGVVHIGDHGSSTRTSYKCVDISVSPGCTYEDIPKPGGLNGIGGQKRMKARPTGELTLLIDEDDGLIADFANKQAKTIVIQLGHTATRTIAFEFPKAYLDAQPVPAAAGNLSGMKIVWHGDEDYSATSQLVSSPLRIHQF